VAAKVFLLLKIDHLEVAPCGPLSTPWLEPPRLGEEFDGSKARNFDRRGFRTETGSVNAPVDCLFACLNGRQVSSGGWPFLRCSVQMGLEPTCLALLALRLQPSVSATGLLKAQRRDGSWGSFATDDETSGLTGLALLTLNTLGTFPDAASHAADWLLDAKGREASWIWKWKFRTTDTRVRFDPDKFGWPWDPGT
jgi:squalene cyclase